jgi:hypothetical protein
MEFHRCIFAVISGNKNTEQILMKAYSLVAYIDDHCFSFFNKYRANIVERDMVGKKKRK